jgi:hypothetical protein
LCEVKTNNEEEKPDVDFGDPGDVEGKNVSGDGA